MLTLQQNKDKIVVIIPAYNEGGELLRVIRSVLSHGIFTVIVVDDGSAHRLDSALHQFSIFYLRHRVNLGQGAAIQTGLEFARSMDADLAITFDADGQHDAEDLPALIAPILEQETDVVFGSRFLEKKVSKMSFRRKMVLTLARIVNFLFSGLLLSDAHNGLRAFNKSALEKIEITENRMAHASEILFLVKKHRLRFKEVPVHISYTTYSNKKGQSGFDGLKVFIDIVLHKLFG
jgi:polyprenyl-phospho-N-acetylgalactosaminyl synthase